MMAQAAYTTTLYPVGSWAQPTLVWVEREDGHFWYGRRVTLGHEQAPDAKWLKGAWERR